MSRKITQEEIQGLAEYNKTHKYVSVEAYQDLLDWMPDNMTELALKLLYDSCVLINGRFDHDKYQNEIDARNGAWFTYNLQEYEDTYDEAMIDYMRKQGLIVLDDPYSQSMYRAVGWVVFPKTQKENVQT